MAVATLPKQLEEPFRDIRAECTDASHASAVPCLLLNNLPNTNDNATDSKNAAQKNTVAMALQTKTDTKEAGKQVRPHATSAAVKYSRGTFHFPSSQVRLLPSRSVWKSIGGTSGGMPVRFVLASRDTKYKVCLPKTSKDHI